MDRESRLQTEFLSINLFILDKILRISLNRFGMEIFYRLILHGI